MNFKLQESCFVCRAEDALGELRGTQSHPINCGWRVKRERDAYMESLEEILKICPFPDEHEVIAEIRKTALKAYMYNPMIKGE